MEELCRGFFLLVMVKQRMMGVDMPRYYFALLQPAAWMARKGEIHVYNTRDPFGAHLGDTHADNDFLYLPRPILAFEISLLPAGFDASWWALQTCTRKFRRR